LLFIYEGIYFVYSFKYEMEFIYIPILELIRFFLFCNSSSAYEIISYGILDYRLFSERNVNEDYIMGY